MSSIDEFGRNAGSWLRRRAENVAVALLAAMSLAFIIQIVFRYALNFPIGWTSELTVTAWLWIVLWGAAFVLREREEIRFDLIYSSVGRRTRRGFAIVTGAALVGLYGLALPASVEYIAFMKVQSTTYLKIRYDHLYSIFAIFAAAIIVRYLWILWQALRGGDTRSAGPQP